ncbi:MAG: 3-oxoacyl-ACP reductase FabG [Christensenellaceae bacterium]|jgi:3-oxoacyl-[acyl-carrier protein] reductase|nr:3-oxoacyl-ACP reductase FabG [Christensenellaceae bacterium]
MNSDNQNITSTLNQNGAKVVVVTGGARGIGCAIALKFGLLGYNIVIGYNNSRSQAEKLKEELEKSCRVKIFRVDVSRFQDSLLLRDFVLQAFGRIDVLINCAGVSLYGLLSEVTQKEIELVFDVNLKGTINITRSFIPSMVKAKSGKIINISSMWGIVGASCEAVYSASKAGVIGFTKAIAKELGPCGITANCIAPGFIKTDMTADFSDDELKDIIKNTPLLRAGTVFDIANATFFLASDDASFITGHTLSVDGGYSL